MATCFDGAGRLAVLLPAAADGNMRPVSPQLCVQYASECSWHMKLDKPRDAPRARLHCELVPQLPKIKLCWLTPQPPFKMWPCREGNSLWKPTNQTPRPLARVRVSDCRTGRQLKLDGCVGAVGSGRHSLNQSPTLASITACRKPLIVNFHSSTE